MERFYSSNCSLHSNGTVFSTSTSRYLTLTAVHAYAGDLRKQQLSFPVGAQILADPGQDGNTWWLGYCNGDKGWFLPSYCRLTTAPKLLNSSSSNMNNNSNVLLSSWKEGKDPDMEQHKIETNNSTIKTNNESHQPQEKNDNGDNDSLTSLDLTDYFTTCLSIASGSQAKRSSSRRIPAASRSGTSGSVSSNRRKQFQLPTHSKSSNLLPASSSNARRRRSHRRSYTADQVIELQQHLSFEKEALEAYHRHNSRNQQHQETEGLMNKATPPLYITIVNEDEQEDQQQQREHLDHDDDADHHHDDEDDEEEDAPEPELEEEDYDDYEDEDEFDKHHDINTSWLKEIDRIQQEHDQLVFNQDNFVTDNHHHHHHHVHPLLRNHDDKTHHLPPSEPDLLDIVPPNCQSPLFAPQVYQSIHEEEEEQYHHIQPEAAHVKAN